jgi:very-short-patch-repair endonuclease
MYKKCLTCELSFETKRISQKYCGYKCMWKSTERNKSIGEKNKCKSVESRKRYKKTMLEKYGVTHNSKLESVKESKQQSSLLKYGTKNVFQSIEVQEKYKQTMLEKHGVDNPSKSPKLLLKKWMSFKDKHGEEHPYLVDKFYSKMKISNGGMTKPEKYIMDFLKKRNIHLICEYPIEWLNIKKYYDFYLPSYNILIEYDGDYWHKNSLEECENDLQINNFRNDRLKDKIAQELGYKLIRITGNNKNIETILENIN